uniref:Uncharacterized protein n=1 Tax=Cannabis sativa TaxID=3483 RepID=A0A803NI90_CANSA
MRKLIMDYGKEPMGSESSNPDQTDHQLRRTQLKVAPTLGPQRSWRIAGIGPDTRITCSRRTSVGMIGIWHRDEEPSSGGTQPMGEDTYETENRRLRRCTEESSEVI